VANGQVDHFEVQEDVQIATKWGNAMSGLCSFGQVIASITIKD
jgi:hypothetical protein